MISKMRKQRKMRIVTKIHSNKKKMKTTTNPQIDNSWPSSTPAKQESNLKINLFSKHQLSTSLLSRFLSSTLLTELRETISSKKLLFTISKKLIMMTKSSKILSSTSVSIWLLEILMKLTKVWRIFKIQPFGKKWQSCVSSAKDLMLLKSASVTWNLPEEQEASDKQKSNHKLRPS